MRKKDIKTTLTKEKNNKRGTSMMKRIFHTLILCIICSALSGSGVCAAMKYDLISKIKKKIKPETAQCYELNLAKKQQIL